MPHWLLLTYKVPPEPAKGRVALWRRLKGLGAVYLQNGVCLLPKTDEHVRRMKMLEKDIADLGGEAVILESVALDRAQEQKVVDRFKADRAEGYSEFIERCADFDKEIDKEMKAKRFNYTEIEENELELKKMRIWLAAIQKLDFYPDALGARAVERLRQCEALLDAFAQKVFEAHEENR